MPRDAATLAIIALSPDEYREIVARLEREPNDLELGMFGAMWSEHCAYKHSRTLLAGLPTSGGRVLVGPGENAGALDIGDGLAVVFKVESHNHPSAVEPYQGAATGVGGIIRDIFTMGARPIAVMEHEHESAGRALRRLRELTGNFTAPPEACNTWRALWTGLDEMEASLHQHIHLENNILFPRALAD